MKRLIIAMVLLSSLSLIAMDEVDPTCPRIVRSDYSDISKHPFELKLEEQYIFEPIVAGLPDTEKAFLKAAWRLNATAVKEHLDAGVSVNVHGKGGCALHFALMSRKTNYDLLEMLLQRGINVNLADNSKLSVLDFAIAYAEHSYNPKTEKAHFPQFFSALLAKKAQTTFEGKTLQDYMPTFNKHSELKQIVESHLKAY